MDGADRDSVPQPALSPGELDWGVVFSRNLPRNSETGLLAAGRGERERHAEQEGTLHGIEGVTGSHNVQINPYVLAQNEHTLHQPRPAESVTSAHAHLEGTAGGEAKAI